MENQLDNLIQQNINPYMVFKIKTNHSINEISDIYSNAGLIFTDKELSRISDICKVYEIDYNTSYVIIRKNSLAEYKLMLHKLGLNYTLNDAREELWNVDSTQYEFTEDFKEILLLIMESTYTLNDVLEKINKGPLNEFNKYVLEKENPQ